MDKPIPKHPITSLLRAGVPLAAFNTADPAATIKACIAALNGKGSERPIIEWDICNGWKGRSDAGTNSLSWYDPLAQQFPETLKLLGEKAEGKTVAFVYNVQRVLERDGVIQGIWNLRDAFKARSCLLVLVGPALTLPVELSQDVVVIDEALPDVAAVGVIVDSLVADAVKAGAKLPADYGRTKAVDTLLGLSAFAAEQALALSVSKAGIDFEGLWERKRRTVEQSPGLSVWKGVESFDSLGGLSNLKTFLKRVLMSGRTPIRAIGFIDEIEKGFAGASGGDLSGVSQDQLMVFLKVMQDSEIPGIILVGPAGTGKSAIAKASGGVCGAEVITIDTGAMTGSLVGESQAKIRQAMEVFKAVSQGKGMFIATCNRITSLPPELRRRFTLGTFYVDLPSNEERKAIWPIWLKRFGFDPEIVLMPEDTGWTGAEIKACCDVAYRADMSLIDASKFIVPVCKSGAEQIEALRKMASGKFISASEPGVYQYRQEQRQGRSLDL